MIPSEVLVGRGRRSRLATVVVIAAFVGAFLAGVPAAGGVVAGFVVLTPLERAFRRHDQPVRRPGLRTDILHALLTGSLSTAGAVAAVVVWSVLLLPVTATTPLPGLFGALPGPVQAVVGFALFELLGYWAHRALHEVPVLWRFHAIHHSSTRLDWLAGVRNHPVEGFLGAALVTPTLLVVGVRPEALGVLAVASGVWAVFLHANVRWRLRLLDGLWGTPEYHHWHHSEHREAWNRNYAAFLPVFDRLFGTYHLPIDRRPERYGVGRPMPDGYLAQLAHPFARRASTAPAASA